MKKVISLIAIACMLVCSMQVSYAKKPNAPQTEQSYTVKISENEGNAECVYDM